MADAHGSKRELKFTRVVAGTGSDPGGDYSQMIALNSEYATLDGLAYSPPALDPSGQSYSFSVLAHINNIGATNTVVITEVGVYAEDTDGNEILFAIDPLYTQPVSVFPPNILAGFNQFQEQTFKIYIEVYRDLQINLELIAEGNMTVEIADGRYWIIGIKYQGTEIIDYTGDDVHTHQRWQDEQINMIIDILESGSTAGTTVNKPVLINKPYNWDILNNNGYRDLATGTIRA